MSTYQVMLLVDVEADSLESAAAQGRDDIAHYARRGSVTITDDLGQRFEQSRDGDIVLSLS